MHSLFTIFQVPKIRIRTDLNEIRYIVCYVLMHSILHMNQGLKHHAMTHLEHPHSNLPNTCSWVMLSEITSITKIYSSYLTFVQHDKL